MMGIRIAALRAVIVLAALGVAPAAIAEDTTTATPSPDTAAPAAAADATATPAAPPANAWATNCSATERAGPLECSIVQRVVLQRTGQLLAMVSIRLPSDSHNPAMLVQTPLGLYLPAGVSLKIDNNTDISLALQTCDNGGCYAGTTVSSAMLSQMRKGHSMTVTFQNISKQDVAIPVALAGFAGAYDKVK